MSPEEIEENVLWLLWCSYIAWIVIFIACFIIWIVASIGATFS